MDILDFEITTDEIHGVGRKDKIIVFLKDTDILQLDNFEFKNATRMELNKFKDCDGFNRAYVYDDGKQIGLLRVEERLYLEKVADVTNRTTGKKGRLLRLTVNKFEIEELNEL